MKIYTFYIGDDKYHAAKLDNQVSLFRILPPTE